MNISKDLMWKSIIEDLPEEFIRFFLSDFEILIDFTQPVIFLDTELQKISRGLRKGKRIADKLLRVSLKDGSDQWFLIHVEIQNQPDPTLPERMFTYFYRIRDKYEKDVTAISIINYKNSHTDGKYYYKYMNSEITYIYHEYNVQKLAPALRDSKNVFSFIIMSAYYDEFYKLDEQKRYEAKFKMIKLLLNRKDMSKQKIRLILNFINDYIRLQQKSYAGKINDFIVTNQKYSQNMGLEELYKSEFAKEAKRIEVKSIKKGIEKGIEKGVLKEKIDVILRGHSNGISLPILSNITGLTEKEVSQIINTYAI